MGSKGSEHLHSTETPMRRILGTIYDKACEDNSTQLPDVLLSPVSLWLDPVESKGRPFSCALSTDLVDSIKVAINLGLSEIQLNTRHEIASNV